MQQVENYCCLTGEWEDVNCASVYANLEGAFAGAF